MLESDVQQKVQIQGMHYGCNLMRNNSGALNDETGRPVRYGLGNVSKSHNDQVKSSDLIGITTITITQEMVGKQIGVFTAFEIKKPEWNKNKTLDKREQAQLNFINFVKLRGGIAEFINNVDDLKHIFSNYLSQLTNRQN